MKIGTVKEIKDNEYRVGMVPGGVRQLCDAGHEVLIQAGAGEGSEISDEQYETSGARIVADADDVFKTADMIIKVKEPLDGEVEKLRGDQILFTYLHLAPLPKLTESLLNKGLIGVAYETITAPDRSLPLLTPMSEVAGRMAVQVGAYYLQKPNGGRGLMIGGVPGVPRGDVVIIGGGVVGLNAAKMAVGLGARVTILERSAPRMRYLDDIFSGRITTLISNPVTILEAAKRAEVLVGAVLIPGAAAPRLVTREMVSDMAPGSVIIDVAVDQGGCIETTRPTTHSNPTFVVDGVIHYCVANMPGAVPRTSTFALTNVTLPYALRIANDGLNAAAKADAGLMAGINTYNGKLTYKAVADDQGREYTPASELVG